MSKTVVEGRVLPDDSVQAQIWSLYERTANITEVADELDISLSDVVSVLDRDPLATYHIRRAFCDQSAARWQDQEAKAARLSNRMVSVVEAMLDHIDTCRRDAPHGHDDKTGEAWTAMVDPRSKDRSRMTVTQAYQWMIQTGQLDVLGRFAMNAARISESMRNIAIGNEATIRKRSASSTSGMTDTQTMDHLIQLYRDGDLMPGSAPHRWAEDYLKAQAARAHSLPSPEQTGASSE